MDKNEMTFTGAPDSATLLLPAEARNRVSRQEFVNLMVVEYIDAMAAKLEARAAPEVMLADAASKAIEAAYVAWREEIMAAVLPRVLPWRDAVQTLLNGNGGELASLTAPTCDAIAVPVTFGFAHVSGADHDRRNADLSPSLSDLFNRILDRKGVPTEPFEPTYSKTKVDLAHARMRWSFAPANAMYGYDHHYCDFTADLRPSEAVRALITTALEACEAHQAYWRETGRIRAEIDDKNVAKLERRALARLTKAALSGDMPPTLIDSTP
jgi:hypothetical protein